MTVFGGTTKGFDTVWRISTAIFVPRRFRRLAKGWKNDKMSSINRNGRMHI